MGKWVARILAVLASAFVAYVIAASLAANPDQVGYILGYVGAAFLGRARRSLAVLAVSAR